MLHDGFGLAAPKKLSEALEHGGAEAQAKADGTIDALTKMAG